MSPALATLLLVVLAGFLVTIPLLPAIIELRLKRDAQPLDVIQQYGGDIRHFAYGFRRIAVELQPQLQECVAAGTTATGALPDGDEYVLLGHPDESFFVPATKRDSTWRSVVVAGADLALPDDLTFAKEIYAAGDLTGGETQHLPGDSGRKRRSSAARQQGHPLGARGAKVSRRARLRPLRTHLRRSRNPIAVRLRLSTRECACDRLGVLGHHGRPIPFSALERRLRTLHLRRPRRAALSTTEISKFARARSSPAASSRGENFISAPARASSAA